MRLLVTSLSFGLFIFLVSPGSLAHDEDLRPAWETGGFENPESVLHDPVRDQLYVSNVNGGPDEKNGRGFISRVSMDGEILALKWISGLDAPKGLALHGDRLYVADIDTLVEIDIRAEKVMNRYRVDDARFLNDVTAGTDGSIYVSDMALDRVHRLKDGQFVIWLEDPDLENPNGLLARDDELIVASWGVMTDGFATDTPGHLRKIDLADKSITSIGPGNPVGNLDGVVAADDGGFYVTDWMTGKLFHIDQQGNVRTLLELNQGSADLDYIAALKLLLIPMMNDGKLLAYRIEAE